MGPNMAPSRMADIVALPILYSFRRCPYAMRARLALLVSGQACEIREVKLSAKPAELIVTSAKATVPVLVLPEGRVIDGNGNDGNGNDGNVIDESLDVMRWALRQNDPEHWLANDDNGGDDAALIATNDGPFKHALDRTKYPVRRGSDAVAHRAEGLVFLELLEARLMGSANLCGPKFALTDAAILPFVRQFAAIDRAWFARQALPATQAWLTRHLASPLFEAAMVRLSPWQPGDHPIMFTGRSAKVPGLCREGPPLSFGKTAVEKRPNKAESAPA